MLADSTLVSAAQAGDQKAVADLLAEHLPLVYNIVRRALRGHSDVDDVVQETMVRVVQGLPGLRDPDRFRAWVISIAFRQVQERGRSYGAAAVRTVPLEALTEHADPAADFVDLTIDHLGGQHAELVAASRWLSPADRRLLALWWQELAGSLSRAEVAAALGLNPQHTAVRLRRMKAQLGLAWTFVRAWQARPRCPSLAAAATKWDGRVDRSWYRRFGRHVAGCEQCRRFGRAPDHAEQLPRRAARHRRRGGPGGQLGHRAPGRLLDRPGTGNQEQPEPSVRVPVLPVRRVPRTVHSRPVPPEGSHRWVRCDPEPVQIFPVPAPAVTMDLTLELASTV